MNIVCPKCTSMEARSLSLIYREGLSFTQTNTTGVGFGGSVAGAAGAGTMNAVSHNSSQSALSRDAAPPRKKNVAGWMMMTAAFGLFLLGSLRTFGFDTLVIAGIALLGAYKVKNARGYNRDAFPRLYNNWQQSFICGRCGNVFVGGLTD